MDVCNLESCIIVQGVSFPEEFKYSQEPDTCQLVIVMVAVEIVKVWMIV